MRKWLLSLGLVCVMTAQLWAAYPVKPYTFTNGTVADATEVNANYDALYNACSTGLNDLNIYRLYIGGTTVIDNTRNASFTTISGTTGTFTGTIIGTREALSDWLTVAGTMGVTGKLSAVNVAASGWETVAGTLGVTGLTTVTSLTATGTITGTREALSDWLTVAGTLGVTGQITGVNANLTGTATIETINGTSAIFTGSLSGSVEGNCIEVIQLHNLSISSGNTDTLTFKFVPSKIVLDYSGCSFVNSTNEGVTNGNTIITITGTDSATSNLMFMGNYVEGDNVYKVSGTGITADTTRLIYVYSGAANYFTATGTWSSTTKTLTLTYTANGGGTSNNLVILATAYK
jgi:hypothetical protein